MKAELPVSDQLKSSIINYDITIKRLIQDVYKCDAQDLLNELNAEGREKLGLLRDYIDKLDTFAQEKYDDLLKAEAKNFREQYYSTFGAFKKANVEAMLAIEKALKKDLFQETDDQAVIRRRKKDKENLVKTSVGITNQLLTISRHLADINQRSGDTLSSLTDSSLNVMNSQTELKTTQSMISQSGKLLDKYTRRQFTDKLLIALGLIFFLACCIYIVKKRMF